MVWQLFSGVFKCNVYGDQPKRDEGNEVSGIELAWFGSCLAEFLSVMYTAPSRSEMKETKFPESSLHGLAVV